MNPAVWNKQQVYPSKIVCIGRNYAEHIKEFDNEPTQEPLIFIKPNSAIADEVHASRSDVIHYEGEITFLIVAGQFRAVGFGLDLTKRELQYELKNKGWPWERAKAFDRSAVFSEFVTFDGDVTNLRMEFLINDEIVQFGGYDLMLTKPGETLRAASSFMTFEDHDLLMTGTPKGVGPVVSGDRYLGQIFDGNNLLVQGSWTVK